MDGKIFLLGYLLEKNALKSKKSVSRERDIESGVKPLEQVNTRTSDFLESNYINTTTKDGVN